VAVKLGIITPIISCNPRFGPHSWEEEAGIEEIAAIVRKAETLGFEFCTFSEHVAVPVDAAAVRGGTYWSPLPTMGYLAAVTSTVRLATYVVVLGYHHPVAILKEYGTLDRILGGRLILGVGVGSLEPEFDLLNAPFAGRGEIADDAIRAIRAGWAKSTPAYDGPVFKYRDFLVEPCGVQNHLPLWVGGRTRRSLRRAIQLADGWAPFGLDLSEVVATLASAGERPERFEVVLRPEPPLDPLKDPRRARAEIERHEAAGATALALRFQHKSLGHYLEQLEALAAIP
jgi:probable F420-dependent oxidoreductase